MIGKILYGFGLGAVFKGFLIGPWFPTLIWFIIAFFLMGLGALMEEIRPEEF